LSYKIKKNTEITEFKEKNLILVLLLFLMMINEINKGNING